MVLQAVCCKTQKYIDKPVISDDGQQCLFVVQSISANDFRGCIGDPDLDKVVSRDNTCRLYQFEAVFSPTCSNDNPLQAFGLCCKNAFRKCLSIPKGVRHIPNIFYGLKAQSRGCGFQFFSVKLEFGNLVGPVIKKYFFDQCSISAGACVLSHSLTTPKYVLLQYLFACVSLLRFYGLCGDWELLRQVIQLLSTFPTLATVHRPI